MFTARILEPATSFKVSTCRCSGSVSVGQTGGNQGKKKKEVEKRKKEKADPTTERHSVRGGEAMGREEERGMKLVNQENVAAITAVI